MEFRKPFEGRCDAPVNQYRLYVLQSVDRLISSVVEFEATSDSAAVALADNLREGRPVELWSGARKLREWQA